MQLNIGMELASLLKISLGHICADGSERVVTLLSDSLAHLVLSSLPMVTWPIALHILTT